VRGLIGIGLEVMPKFVAVLGGQLGEVSDKLFDLLAAGRLGVLLVKPKRQGRIPTRPT
jgi:hypothetical protein